MCGIAGFTHKASPASAERIWAITRSLHHRGPDEQNVWQSDVISLGAVRLKIIDLKQGQQPMVSGDGGRVIAFNGEVYNHAELRAELAALGHHFHSRCDTEVVLHAFMQWDTAAFARLRGMFAAALWSVAQQRLVLVRDRIGIKPLYIHHRAGDLYFGSEMKTILLHPEVDRRINMLALDRYLSCNYVPGTASLVEGTEQLAPGHWLEWRNGVCSTHPYWQLQFKPDPTLDFETAKSELDRLLRASIKEHLISDAPLGVWSSGGLDSSTILHYAAQESPKTLKTFSVSFRGRSFDESQFFREVSRHYKTEHHEYDLSPDATLADAVQQFAGYSDDPSADAGALPIWFLSKMCRSEVTVALSGDGADELFGGYTTYLADRYARTLRHVPFSLRSLAARAAHLLPVSDEKIGFDYKVTRMLEGALLHPVAAHFYWNGTFGEAQKQGLLALPGAHATPLPLPGHENISYLNRFLFLDQLCYLPNDILVKCDRMSMAHSLEVRPPFLDHRIVEFAATLPENFKIRGGSLKHILRELMRGKLPPAVLNRPKQGFDIPAHHWLRNVLRPLLEETLSEKNVRGTGVFSWPGVHHVLQAHLQRRANFGYHLWGLLILLLWMKRWQIQPPTQMQPAAPIR